MAFKKSVLDELSVNKNPFLQFQEWYKEAERFLGEDASAMALTTSANKRPNARIVYLRGNDKASLWFFTNYTGQKAKELRSNNNACLLFFWPKMSRQVRIQGKVEKLSSKESNRYFESRPRGSRIGAWSSPQSEVIPNRAVLDARVKEFTKKFEGKNIPRPPHWGGYRVIVTTFEFWQSGESRLHDRITFKKQKNGKWKMERLAP